MWRLTEVLVELLAEHERQAVEPDVWRDGAFKSRYYRLYNAVYDCLNGADACVDGPDHASVEHEVGAVIRDIGQRCLFPEDYQ